MTTFSKRQFLALFFCTITTCGLSVSSWAKNIYVDQDCGNGITTYNPAADSCSGGSDVSYSTIKNAISAMNGGDDIFLRGGTYYEHDIYVPSSKSGTASNWSSLQSYPGEWAKIDGQWQCSTNPRAVIYNTTYAEHDSFDAANYWLFERIEITGGGYNAVLAEQTGHGIYWSFGPWTIRYSYVHDNIGPWTNENPTGIGGITWQGATIEYNYVANNRSAQGYGNNVFNIGTASTYIEYDTGYDFRKTAHENNIRYNLVKGEAGGIRTKGAVWLNQDRSGNSTTNMDNGDKIHHNIVIQTNNSSVPGIFYQADYVQIYNNIVDQEQAAKAWENWPIATRRIRTYGQRDLLQSVIYNNTIYSGASELGNFHEGDGSGVAEWYVYNNILDSMSYYFSPISFGCSSGGCTSYSKTTQHSLAKLFIDRNYIYRPTGSTSVYVGNASWPTGSYTAEGWEAAKPGTDIFRQSYSSSNPLYEGTTGAAKYTTIGEHTVEGSKDISTAGIGGDHPYLSGVQIPSYIGATNPCDNNWVDVVLNNLPDVNWLKAQTSASPTWVEGGGSGSCSGGGTTDPPPSQVQGFQMVPVN